MNNNTVAPMNLIEIFRAGTRRDANGKLVTISRDDLQKAVDNYSAEYHEAPIVIGHPKTDTPAFGWIAGLQLDGDVLKAHTKQVDSEFAELVREGKYKKISSAFYLPGSASNPKPDGFYLRHVGFLGGMPPAVKGLADPVFNDNAADVVEFSDWQQASLWSKLRDFMIEQFGLEKTDDVLPAWQVQSLHEEAVRESLSQINSADGAPIFNEPTLYEKKLPELHDSPRDTTIPTEPSIEKGEPMSEQDKTRLAELEAENALLKAEQANVLKAQAEAANAEFAEALVTEGKLTPKLKDSALALLNADHGSAEFSEDGYKDKLKSFLSALPKAVEFAEVATKEVAASPEDDSVVYAEGTDASLIEADKRVKAHMKAHGVDYTTAFKQIFN